MIELVWDQQRAGTATSASGRCVAVGEGAEFSPEELLATSAAACLMRTSVGLAASSGVDLLSFTATAWLNISDMLPAPRVDVRARMVISDEVPEARMLGLWNQALLESPVARLLGAGLCAEIEVTRICASSPQTKKRKKR